MQEVKEPSLGRPRIISLRCYNGCLTCGPSWPRPSLETSERQGDRIDFCRFGIVRTPREPLYLSADDRSGFAHVGGEQGQGAFVEAKRCGGQSGGSQPIAVLPGSGFGDAVVNKRSRHPHHVNWSRGSPKAGVIWHRYSNHVSFTYPPSRERGVLSFVNDSRFTFAESFQRVETSGTRSVQNNSKDNSGSRLHR